RFGRLVAIALFVSVLLCGQSQQNVSFGGKYSNLQDEQKNLIERWTREIGKIVGTQPDPEHSYDELPLSSRTTYEAITNALLHTTLTNRSGKPIGRAIDLVDVIERIAGRVGETRGDHQFRVYVYLKPDALDKLSESREFKREHDN